MCFFVQDIYEKGLWELFGVFQREKDFVGYGYSVVMSMELVFMVLVSNGC